MSNLLEWIKVAGVFMGFTITVSTIFILGTIIRVYLIQVGAESYMVLSYVPIIVVGGIFIFCLHIITRETNGI